MDDFNIQLLGEDGWALYYELQTSIAYRHVNNYTSVKKKIIKELRKQFTLDYAEQVLHDLVFYATEEALNDYEVLSQI